MIEGLLAATAPTDIDELLNLVHPDQASLVHTYRDALEEALARSDRWEGLDSLTDLETAVRVQVDHLRLDIQPEDDDRARVALRDSTGTVHYEADEESGELTWTHEGSCAQYTVEVRSADEPEEERSDGGGCAADTALTKPGRPLGVAQDHIGDPYLIVIREGDRWYLSITDTVTDYLVTVVDTWEELGVLDRAIFASAERPEIAAPDETITLGPVIATATDPLGLAVYAIDSPASPYGLQVCTSTPEVETLLTTIGVDDELRLVVWHEPGLPFDLQVLPWDETCAV